MPQNDEQRAKRAAGVHAVSGKRHLNEDRTN
jgi:hypothetical protein